VAVDLEGDVRAYATLAARLARDPARRAELLAAHGLDEDRWEALDDAWQARLDRAADSDEDGVPALVAAHAEAFADAQRGAGADVLPFERYVEAARELRRGHDMTTALKRLSVTFDQLMRAQRHWTAAMLSDPALAARFQRAVR
jgi:glyoxylase-like metal-dependent hydrolase (beta-lactamase superfamily II)